MVYVIMNVGTGRLHCKQGWANAIMYNTERGAKGTCTKLNKQYGDTTQWVVISSAEFEANYNPVVTVFNCLTGKPCQIRKSEQGGCTDPSTERYHCM